jgi:hypothetical protein
VRKKWPEIRVPDKGEFHHGDPRYKGFSSYSSKSSERIHLSLVLIILKVTLQ